jgi:hypothetical protein
MAGPLTKALGRTAGHVPGLRRLPILKLLAVAELLVLARAHAAKLEPAEWRRMAELVRAGRGRPSNLTPRQRRELSSLIEKAEPRVFAGQAINRLSPVSIPDQLLYGSWRASKALRKR